MLIISNGFSSEASGPMLLKFHAEPPRVGECDGSMLTFDLLASKVKFASLFVWAIYIYIESVEVTCRSTVVKIVLIGNLRWPSSGLYL